MCSPPLFNALPMCVAAQNSGVEVMSGVASRFVTAIAGVIFGLMAIFPKFSQVLALIPNPVLGGILLVTFGNIIASGIKVIGFDENNKRNFTIIALAAAVGNRRQLCPGRRNPCVPSLHGSYAVYRYFRYGHHCPGTEYHSSRRKKEEA